MYEEILKWACLVNFILLIPILIRAPRAIRLCTEAELLQRQAELLNAEIEQEKVARGITYADYYRDLLKDHEKLTRLYALAYPKPEVTPCSAAPSSSQESSPPPTASPTEPTSTRGLPPSSGPSSSPPN